MFFCMFTRALRAFLLTEVLTNHFVQRFAFFEYHCTGIPSYHALLLEIVYYFGAVTCTGNL